MHNHDTVEDYRKRRQGEARTCLSQRQVGHKTTVLEGRRRRFGDRSQRCIAFCHDGDSDADYGGDGGGMWFPLHIASRVDSRGDRRGDSDVYDGQSPV